MFNKISQKEPEHTTREFFNCDCHTEGVVLSREVYKWSNDHIDESIYLNFWSYGHKYQNGKLPFKDKIRWCWQILTTGVPYPDGVILHPKEARKLGESLLNTAKEVERKYLELKENSNGKS